MNIIIMGAPFSGKGTLCTRISQERSFYHINTGQILRDEQAKGTKLGLMATRIINVGGYMPDELMIPIVRECVINSENASGRLFDGFPRTKEQAKQLHAFMTLRKEPIAAVIFLNMTKNTAMDRMHTRAESEGRADDNEQAMVNRWSEYEQKTLPLIEYFAKFGLIHTVDADGSKESVYEQANAIIEELIVAP